MKKRRAEAIAPQRIRRAEFQRVKSQNRKKKEVTKHATASPLPNTSTQEPFVGRLGKETDRPQGSIILQKISLQRNTGRTGEIVKKSTPARTHPVGETDPPTTRTRRRGLKGAGEETKRPVPNNKTKKCALYAPRWVRNKKRRVGPKRAPHRVEKNEDRCTGTSPKERGGDSKDECVPEESRRLGTCSRGKKIHPPQSRAKKKAVRKLIPLQSVRAHQGEQHGTGGEGGGGKTSTAWTADRGHKKKVPVP